jgi:hypothetical protein
MIDDPAPRATPAPEADVPNPEIWASAEFLDRQFPGGITLRALVCPLEGGNWQWSVISLDATRGEVIGVGIEQSAAGARVVALSELAKCFSDPLD